MKLYFTIVFALCVGLLCFVFLSKNPTSRVENFKMSGTLQCRFVKKWGNWPDEDLHIPLVVTDLYSTEPQIKFPNGGNYSYSIEYQDHESITIEDIRDGIFSLNKIDGTFAMTNLSVGGVLGTVVEAGIGYCW